MSGLTATLDIPAGRLPTEEIADSLNKSGHMDCTTMCCKGASLSVSAHRLSPGNDKRVFNDDEYLGVLAGDVVSNELFDWASIALALSRPEPDFRPICDLRGTFAISLSSPAVLTPRLKSAVQIFAS